MTLKTIDLLCLGNPCADVVVRCDRVPAWDDKCVGSAVGTYAGGTESNVACAASRLGWRTAIFGDVGDDAHAGFLGGAFAADNVSTRWLRQRRQTASASTLLMISPEGERALVWVPMPPAARSGEELDVALACSRIAYTMPYDVEELARLQAAARRHGAQLAIDVEREAARRPDLLPRLLNHCDIAFMNESGYVAATGRAPDDAGLSRLFDAGGAHTLVVTLGERGAIAIDRQGVASASAFAVQVVDATGAGDSFNAAFLVARERGTSLSLALRFACAAASRTVGAFGARSALPRREDVAAVVASGTMR